MGGRLVAAYHESCCNVLQLQLLLLAERTDKSFSLHHPEQAGFSLAGSRAQAFFVCYDYNVLTREWAIVVTCEVRHRLAGAWVNPKAPRGGGRLSKKNIIALVWGLPVMFVGLEESTARCERVC